MAQLPALSAITAHSSDANTWTANLDCRLLG